MNAPITKYKTNHSQSRIQAVAIERETEQSVWIDGQRSAKRSEYVVYHDSWSDAHKYLMVKAEANVMAARRSLEFASSKLGNIRGMREPT